MHVDILKTGPTRTNRNSALHACFVAILRREPQLGSLEIVLGSCLAVCIHLGKIPNKIPIYPSNRIYVRVYCKVNMTQMVDGLISDKNKEILCTIKIIRMLTSYGRCA